MSEGYDASLNGVIEEESYWAFSHNLLQCGQKPLEMT
jgi:hypothetical protein